MDNLIEKLGLEKCKSIVSKSGRWTHITKCGRFFFNDNDSHGEVIMEHGSNPISINDIRNAIADHERTDHCTNFENHISPNTKVINHD